MIYKKTSEWVSVGHPDRCADCIASRIINDIYKLEMWNGHAAVEVALFDNVVIIGGEVNKHILENSEYFKKENITNTVREVLDKIGYNKKYRNKFSIDEVYISSDYEVKTILNSQSEDIANGIGVFKYIKERLWNDQGTYIGYACNKTPNGLSLEHYFATEIGNKLYKEALNSDLLGIDIKTLVTCEYNNESIRVSDITIACPMISDALKEKEAYSSIYNVIQEFINSLPEDLKKYFNTDIKYIINGTGVYHKHGSFADSGVTGRKLVVNQCGNYAAGGSMIKPILAPDRLLNLYARHVAKVLVDAKLCDEASVELSASIGRGYIGSIKINGLYDSNLSEKIYDYFTKIQITPFILNEKWETLERNNFDEVVFNNFFGSSDYYLEPWEDTKEDVSNILYEILKN